MSFIGELQSLLKKIRELRHIGYFRSDTDSMKDLQIVVDKIKYYSGMSKFNRVFRNFNLSEYYFVSSGTNRKLLDTCERIVQLLITEVNTWPKRYKRTTNGIVEEDNSFTLKLPFFETPVTNREAQMFVIGLIVGILITLLFLRLGTLYIF